MGYFSFEMHIVNIYVNKVVILLCLLFIDLKDGPLFAQNRVPFLRIMGPLKTVEQCLLKCEPSTVLRCVVVVRYDKLMKCRYMYYIVCSALIYELKWTHK